MSMDTITDQTPEAAPVETPPAPAPADNDLDVLLAQYDREVPATDEPVATDVAPDHTPTVDEQIAQILGPDPKIAELQTQVDSLRAEQHRAEELKAFNLAADNLQKQLPHWLPEDYAVTKLKALAHDPEIALAWDLRNTDKAAANLELQKVQVALYRLQQDPNADPAKVAQLNQYGYRLQVALNSSAILRKATLGILNEANKLPPPLDPEANQIRADVAWAVKGASSKRIAEPPPNYGKMSANEGRRKIIDEFGFDPGWKD